ncbi:hypothetical protein AZZ99_000949, partial [Serratia marcescens]
YLGLLLEHIARNTYQKTSNR